MALGGEILVAAAAAAALCFGAPRLAAQDTGDQSLVPYGFDISASELIKLEMLNAAVRYDSAQAIEENWRGEYDNVTVVDVPATKGRYALFEDDKARRMDIAIRGTSNLRNTAFDLKFLKKRSERLGIYLHSGFEASALAIYGDLRPRLKEGYALRIAGHSLGAAVAIILGMLLESDGIAVEKVLASAPPKVTDAEGWIRFPSLKVIRVACPYDPVPFLPPHNFIYDEDPYIQGGKILFLLEERLFTVLEGSYYDDLPDAVKNAFAEGKNFGAAEHRLPAYLARLIPKKTGFTFVDASEWEDKESFSLRAGEVPAGR
jgi:hypothetical protein